MGKTKRDTRSRMLVLADQTSRQFRWMEDVIEASETGLSQIRDQRKQGFIDDPKNDRERSLQKWQNEGILEAIQILPILQWNAIFLTTYAVMERALSQLSNVVFDWFKDNSDGPRLKPSDLRKNGVSESLQYLVDVARIEYDDDKRELLELLQEYRNVSVHSLGITSKRRSEELRRRCNRLIDCGEHFHFLKGVSFTAESKGESVQIAMDYATVLEILGVLKNEVDALLKESTYLCGVKLDEHDY